MLWPLICSVIWWMDLETLTEYSWNAFPVSTKLSKYSKNFVGWTTADIFLLLSRSKYKCWWIIWINRNNFCNLKWTVILGILLFVCGTKTFCITFTSSFTSTKSTSFFFFKKKHLSYPISSFSLNCLF